MRASSWRILTTSVIGADGFWLSLKGGFLMVLFWETGSCHTKNLTKPL